MASWIPRVSDRKMCCGMRAARRRFHRLLPTRGLLENLSWSRLLRARKRSYLFPRVVAGMDGVWVIYVSAQTHLIYSPKHNSLTLFREKCSYILVTLRRVVRHLARYENANTDFPSLHPRTPWTSLHFLPFPTVILSHGNRGRVTTVRFFSLPILSIHPLLRWQISSFL